MENGLVEMNIHLGKIGLAAAAGLALSGCVSTKDFDEHVADVNTRASRS